MLQQGNETLTDLEQDEGNLQIKNKTGKPYRSRTGQGNHADLEENEEAPWFLKWRGNPADLK
jgi:hypothetical protein